MSHITQIHCSVEGFSKEPHLTIETRVHSAHFFIRDNHYQVWEKQNVIAFYDCFLLDFEANWDEAITLMRGSPITLWPRDLSKPL